MASEALLYLCSWGGRICPAVRVTEGARFWVWL